MTAANLDANQKIAQFVREGADFLEAHSWHRFAFGTPEIGVCAVGAMQMARGAVEMWPLDPMMDVTLAQLAAWLYGAGFLSREEWTSSRLHAIYRDMSTVGAWNDQEGQTKDEIVRVLRKFADEIAPQA